MVFKFPKEAKRVFKGVLFDVYQWQQKMFDGSFSTFEVAKRQDTVVILATVKDRIVVLKQKQPDKDWYYDLPAGRMDIEGEAPRTAALRELLEETGMKPKTFKLWKKVIHGSGKVFSTVHFYKAHGCVKSLDQKLDPGEKIEVGLYTFEEFLKMSDWPNGYFGEELTIDMLKARLDYKFKKRFKQELFS